MSDVDRLRAAATYISSHMAFTGPDHRTDISREVDELLRAVADDMDSPWSFTRAAALALADTILGDTDEQA